MISLNLAAAARTLEASFDSPDQRFTGVSTDTRSLEPGELFVALRGPRFDAHDLVTEAFERGAVAAVVERPLHAPGPLLTVTDTRRALGVLARDWRQRFGIPVIAVTGSAGKTTVKEMIAAVLGVHLNTLATRGNLNNDIGVPLTLFRLGAEHEAAVIEMGANRAGDITQLCAIARPSIGVITLCAPSHLEGFGDIDTVARTKGQIVSSLDDDGIAVINDDDAYAPMWRGMARQRRVVGFAIDRDSDVVARDIEHGDNGVAFDLCLDGAVARVTLHHRGLHNVRNALAAAAACHAAGVALATVVQGLAGAAPVKGRLQWRRGVHGATIIDDTYNANPASLAAALDVLAMQPGARWLVLGDMGELGAEAARFHREAGAAASVAGVARMFTLGPLAHVAHERFSATAAQFATHEDLIAGLRDALAAAPQPVTVLVKGSRFMALERVVAALDAGEAVPC